MRAQQFSEDLCCSVKQDFSYLHSAPSGHLQSPHLLFPLRNNLPKFRKTVQRAALCEPPSGLVTSLIKSCLKVKLRSPSHLSAFEIITSDLNSVPYHIHVMNGKVFKHSFCHSALLFLQKCEWKKLCWWSSPPASAGSPQENVLALVFHSANETDLTLN